MARPGYQSTVILYSGSFVHTQPEAAKRWMLAYLKGLRDYVDAFSSGARRDEVIDILIKHTPVKDRALYATMLPVGFEPNGRVNVDYLRGEQELYRREGLLTDPIDVATMVDHQYVDYAVSRLGRR